MSKSSTIIESLREHRILDPAHSQDLDTLVTECGEPEELVTRLLDRGSLTRYQAERLLSGQSKELVLGQYVLLEKLGEGGMGQVFKARHQRMKRIVALKVIRKDVATGPQAVLRFNQEIEAAAQLHHPNVVIAYDANEVNETLFFVMEYVEGIDLSRLVHRAGPLPIGQACEYIRQAAAGLQHAHERGLIHRDIKPSNLLLTFADSIVKVLDMGLARFQQVLDAPTNLTRTGTVIGTPDFISPEQARDAHSVDIRADLYSLGCSLYFLLTDRVPFPEGSFTEKLLKHNMDEPEPVEQLRPEVPAGLAAIICKLMAKKPQDRYATPAEVVEALRPYAEPQGSAERYRQEDATDWQQDSSAHASTVGEPHRARDDSLTPVVEPRTEPLSKPAPAFSAVTEPGTQAGKEASLSATANLSSPARPSSGTGTWRDVERKSPESDATHVEKPVVAARKLKPGTVSLIRAGAAVLAGLGIAALVMAYFHSRQGLSSTDVPKVAVSNPKPSPDPDKDKAILPGKDRAPDKDKATAPDKDKDPTKDKDKAAGKDKDKAPAKDKDKAAVKDKVKPPVEPVLAPPQTGVICRIPPKNDANNKNDLKLAISRDGRWLAGGWNGILRQDGVVRVYDLAHSRDGSDPVRIQNQCDLTALALAADGSSLLLGTTKEVKMPGRPPQFPWALGILQMASKEELRQFGEKAHSKKITCLAVSSDGLLGLSGSEDSSIRLWNLKSGEKIHGLDKHKGRVVCVAISDDGRLALSGDRYGKIILWNLEEGKELHTFSDHSAYVTCVAFSRDGKSAVSGSFDKTMRLWDLDQRKLVRTFAHKQDVTAVAFSTDGRFLLSGTSAGTESTVLLWNRDNAVSPLEQFTDHKGEVQAVSFDAIPGYILSASSDFTVRRWASKAKGLKP